MLTRLATLVVLVLAAAIALADKITLTDGSVLDGTAIKQGDKYWIKLADGSTKTIPANTVESITKADGAATGSGTGAKPAVSSGANFAATKRKADLVTNALAAVPMWQKFIDDNSTSPDLDAAQKELDKWQKMADEGAEKIMNKWVTGDELKKIHEKHNKLLKEGFTMMRQNQTLPAIKKYEEALKVYPNSFRTNFFLGYVNILADKNNEAHKYLDACLRMNPKSAETLNNKGVALMRQQKYVEGIEYLYKAAQYGDNKFQTQNLVNAIAQLPIAARQSPKVKPAMEAATLLASKYGVGGPSNMVTIIGLGKEGDEEPGAESERFALSSGTGFFINDAGLVLTNRHVVKGAKTIMIIMDGKKQQSAEVVVIDEEQDLALIKLKIVKDKTPFVQLTKANNPNDGAECTVMGFPLIDRIGAQIKITRGIVSSGTANQEGADVVTDAKVNPGNSGGPLLDKFGHVIGVVTMKSANSTFEDSYGMAISSGKVKRFLEKNNIILTFADAGTTAMSTEEIAKKIKPATVCILCTEKEKE